MWTFSKERGQRETSGRSSSARNDAVTVVQATGLEFLVDLFRPRLGRLGGGRGRLVLLITLSRLQGFVTPHTRACAHDSSSLDIRDPRTVSPLELWLRGMRFLSTLFYLPPRWHTGFDWKRSNSKL